MNSEKQKQEKIDSIRKEEEKHWERKKKNLNRNKLETKEVKRKFTKQRISTNKPSEIWTKAMSHF